MATFVRVFSYERGPASRSKPGALEALRTHEGCYKFMGAHIPGLLESNVKNQWSPNNMQEPRVPGSGS